MHRIFFIRRRSSAFLSCNGRILREHEEKLMPKETQACVEEIYELAGNRDISNLLKRGDDDFSSRFRDFPDSVSAPTNSVVHSLRSSVSLPLICHIRKISVSLILSWIFQIIQRSGSGHRSCRKRQIHYACVSGQPDQPHDGKTYHHAGGSHRIPAPA